LPVLARNAILISASSTAGRQKSRGGHVASAVQQDFAPGSQWEPYSHPTTP